MWREGGWECIFHLYCNNSMQKRTSKRVETIRHLEHRRCQPNARGGPTRGNQWACTPNNQLWMCEGWRHNHGAETGRVQTSVEAHRSRCFLGTQKLSPGRRPCVSFLLIPYGQAPTLGQHMDLHSLLCFFESDCQCVLRVPGSKLSVLLRHDVKLALRLLQLVC